MTSQEPGVSGRKIWIFDTTLRDGEQSPGATMTVEEKLGVADALVALGVDIIEAGFPAASPGDFEAVKLIAQRVKGSTVAGLARTNTNDIEQCARAIADAERPRIHTFIATSDIHLKHKLRMSREEVLERVEAMVKLARSFVEDVEFSAEDATRTDWAYLVEVFTRAIEAGATTLNVPDTVGYTTPKEYADLMAYLQEHVPGIDDVVISVHCHNDLGMGTANTLAAIAAGARQAEVTVNGIGERAGNTALEEVVMALTTRGDQFGRAYTNITSSRIVPTSRLISSITGLDVQVNKAIVGENAFAHEAGIHQDGMLKERTTYEIMNPADVGWEGTKLVLGKHSGRAGFKNALNELGLKLPDEEIHEAYLSFLALADKKKRVTAADLVALVKNQVQTRDDIYHLMQWRVDIASGEPANASVVLGYRDTQIIGNAEGNGPVDAILQAIDAATGKTTQLEYYNVEAVTPGEDAQGQVNIRIRSDDHLYTGHGLATDIVEASARAYLDAISKLEIGEPSTVLAGSSTSRWS
jgi:2-isopropylmalate synthase